MFGRAIGSYAVTAFLALILLAGVGASQIWIQIGLSFVLIAGMCYISFLDGGARGERACTVSATVERIKNENGKVESDMLKDCFSKKVALTAYALIASVLLLVSVINIIAAPYYPPVIISSVNEMSLEEMAAAYEAMTDEEVAAMRAEAEKARASTNYFNVAARAVFMPFFSVYPSFNDNPEGLNLLFLLFSVLIPIPEVAGYLMGPSLRVRKLKAIEAGKKRKLKKLRVNQKKREIKPPKMEV